MGKMYILMAYSGAGKDSLAREIQKLIPAVNIKWSRPMKDMFDLVYGLPPGFLDDPVLRLQLVPGHPEGITWLDLMIRAYVYFPKLDPNMMIQKVIRDIRRALSDGEAVILTDTRNLTEEAIIRQLYDEGHQIYLVEIKRPNVLPKASDQLCEDITWKIVRYSSDEFLVKNNGDIEQLRLAAQDIVYDTY